MRRKKLSNGLAAGFPELSKDGAAQVITDCGFDENVRGETLDIEGFAKLARAIAEREREKEAKSNSTQSSAPQRRKLSFKEQRELEQLEKDIAELEHSKKELEEQLSSGALSHEELMNASARIAQTIEELETKEMRWLELSEI
jgi:septal ring factor EnvC (AmiA/AmiB activator)